MIYIMNLLETERLILRTWEKADLEPMCAINQDTKVMEYFPSLQDRATTQKLIEKFNRCFEHHGYTFHATVRKDTGVFIGFIGLSFVDMEVAFAPSTEIGWRLASQHWGEGFATEGAKAVLHYAFTALHLPEVVAFTAKQNTRSQRAMEKIGLKHHPEENFEHPRLSDDSPLRRHVLYRLSQERYFTQQQA